MAKEFGFRNRREFERTAQAVRRTEGAIPPLRPGGRDLQLASTALDVIVEVTGPAREDVLLKTRVWPAKLVAKNYLRESEGEIDWVDSTEVVFAFDINDNNLAVGTRYKAWVYGVKTWVPPIEDWIPPEPLPADQSPQPIESVIVYTDAVSSVTEESGSGVAGSGAGEGDGQDPLLTVCLPVVVETICDDGSLLVTKKYAMLTGRGLSLVLSDSPCESGGGS